MSFEREPSKYTPLTGKSRTEEVSEAAATILLACRQILLTGEFDEASKASSPEAELATLAEVVRYLVTPPPTNDEWRLFGIDDAYAVSSSGDIWLHVFPEPDAERYENVWEKLTPTESESGYLYVNIDGKPKQVSHIVLEQFIGPRPSPAMEACHYPDRSPRNNRISNLRWDTRAENTRDRRLLWLKDRGIDQTMIEEIYRLYFEVGLSRKQVAAVIMLEESAVSNIIGKFTKMADSIDPDLIREDDAEITKASQALGRLGGRKGGDARAKALSSERRSEIARIGGLARWAKKSKAMPEDMPIEDASTGSS